MAPCDECGYASDSLHRDEILAEVRSLAAQYPRLLMDVRPDRLRDHSRPGSWSALEYGCHVRDLLRVQHDRVALAQAEQTPRFASMRRDERAIEERYNDQDPGAVAGDIVSSADQFAGALGALDDAGWIRAGIYPWPEPQVRTVEWIGRRAAHELAHHLFDIRCLLLRSAS